MSLPSAKKNPNDTSPPGRGGAGVSGSVPTAASADPMIGRVLDGRFTIGSRLGAGSMGTVYRAKQHAMGRDIAIKILRSDRALDDAARARFLREARANSLLASPHTVTVFDFGQADNGDFFLAMELLEGESVGQRLQREKRLSADQAVETARQALRSLAEAHAKGIIHRDLKPDNLFYAKVLSNEGQHEEIVKVLDFGIAKMLSAENAAMNAVETQAGTVFGTPRYMSPEQAQGKPLDARSDLYSLGVILYHMLTGRPPFTDDDAIVVMARHIKTPPKSPSEAAPQANIPQEVENVLIRVLAKEPSQRPSSAEQMSQELARAMNLAVTATSGVRASLATVPPSSTSTPGSVRPPPPPPSANNGVASTPFVPPPPASLGSLSASHGAVNSSQLAAAAGVPRNRKRWVTIAITVAVLSVVTVVAWPRGNEPAPVQVVSPPRTEESPIPPPPPPLATTPAPAQVASGAAPPGTGSIPSTTFNALPRATSPRPAPPPPRPKGNSRGQSQPSPQSAPSSSNGHYGIFE